MQQRKSTPYSQLMTRNGKTNSKFYMLKEEYERMLLVDERKIEMKMRKIRLTQLKKNIEEIKKFNSIRLSSKDLAKTKEEKRMENIKRSRALGQYFSQRNMKEALAESKINMNSQLLKKRTGRFGLLDSKRVKYDNEIFYCRTENHHLRNPRKELEDNIKFKPTTDTHYKTKRNHMSVTINSSKVNKEKKTIPTKKNLTKTTEFIDFQMDKSRNNVHMLAALSENVQFIDLEAIDFGCSENYDKRNNSILPFESYPSAV